MAMASSSVSAKDAPLTLAIAGYKWPFGGPSDVGGKRDEAGVRGELREPEVVEDGVEVEDAMER